LAEQYKLAGPLGDDEVENSASSGQIAHACDHFLDAIWRR
jgi:hypothetical protein